MVLPKLVLSPDQDGYNVRPGENAIMTEVGGGKPRMRLDQMNTASDVDVQWKCDPGEFQYLMAFYNTQLKRGSLPFEIDLLLGQPYVVTHEAIFVPGSLQCEPEGVAMTVQATLKVVPIIDTGVDEVTLALAGVDGWFTQFEQLVNYDMQI